MSTCNCGWGSELVHISSTGGWSIQALLDAIACGLDQGKSEVNLNNDTSDIETGRISDTAFILGLDAWTDGVESSACCPKSYEADAKERKARTVVYCILKVQI
jgi:hypothetical protein